MKQHLRVMSCCLLAVAHSAMAQVAAPLWKEDAQDQLIGRPDTVIISWHNDVFSISMGKVAEDFDANIFARDVVCETLVQAGKPAQNSVNIAIYTLMLDRFEWNTEPAATYICN